MYTFIREKYADLVFPFGLPDCKYPNICKCVDEGSGTPTSQEPIIKEQSRTNVRLPPQTTATRTPELKRPVRKEPNRQVKPKPVTEETRFLYAYPLTEFLKESLKEPEKQEYKTLKELDQANYVSQFKAEAANKPSNEKFNRYINIYPYDFNRIKLQTAVVGTDYINASYVTGPLSVVKDPMVVTPRPPKIIYTGEKAQPYDFSKYCNINFLAAQGPLPVTCAHFWQAVYENDVDIIVMLTKLKEGGSGSYPGQTKCTQYWPSMSEKKLKAGNFEITIIEEIQVRPGITKRIFGLQGKDATNSNQEHLVTQLQYVGWPDYGIPEEDDHLINLVKNVRYIIQSDREKISRKERFTVFAHCSAGVGRTGTFIAMYQMMDQIEEMLSKTQTNTGQSARNQNQCIDIFNTTLSLRSKRVEMVQSWAQYRYLYKSVAAYAKQVKSMNDADYYLCNEFMND